MKLILTRHGETEENKRGILQGHLPGNLSKEGKEQAKKVALRLKNEKIDAVYSSDLKRAKDTAKEILKFHKNITVHYVKELREGNVGSYTGRIKSEVDINHYPDDAEKLEKIRERAEKVLDKIYSKNKDKIVLFVTHSGIYKTILSIILDMPFENIKKEIGSPKNTAVSIFEIREDKKHKIHLLNCIKHLENE